MTLPETKNKTLKQQAKTAQELIHEQMATLTAPLEGSFSEQFAEQSMKLQKKLSTQKYVSLEQVKEWLTQRHKEWKEKIQYEEMYVEEVIPRLTKDVEC